MFQLLGVPCFPLLTKCLRVYVYVCMYTYLYMICIIIYNMQITDNFVSICLLLFDID